MTQQRVLIIGGGLAGIAAAAALTPRGWHTTLIDRRPMLGGRATSIVDPTNGALLDNCQHVLLGCCTNLLHLYDQLGQRDAIEFFDTIHFADQHGRRGDLYASPLPSPAHLSWSMLRFALLTADQKMQIARGMLAIRLMGDQERQSLRNMSFGAWLSQHRQSKSTIDRFWDVIITSALNEHAQSSSAYHAVQVFAQAFLGNRRGYRMGVPRVPLADLYHHAVASEIRTSIRCEKLVWDPNRQRITGAQLLSGETVHADRVILATAPDAASRLLGDIPPMQNIASALAGMEQAPIIGAHLFYDRPVMELPHLALVGTTLDWLFRKDAAGKHLHCVISAAQDLVEIDQASLAGRFDAEVRQLLPAARDAVLVRSVIIKEKRATFRPLPGLDAIRPAQRTAVKNLVLAGDYTQTDWPGTMEGAVRSGYRAAQVLSGEVIERPDLGR